MTCPSRSSRVFPFLVVATLLASCTVGAPPTATPTHPPPTIAPPSPPPTSTPKPPTATPLPTATEITATSTDDATYDDLLAKFGSWTRQDAEAAGFAVEPVCVPRMGYHAADVDLHPTNVLITSEPSILLIDKDGNVVGVEYEITGVVSDPPLIAGHPFLHTDPHPGMPYDHMSLHIYFVGSPDNRFGETNPAVKC